MCKKFFETFFNSKTQDVTPTATDETLKALKDNQEILAGRLDNLEVDLQSQISCQIGEMFNQERENFKLDCDKMIEQIIEALATIQQYEAEIKKSKCKCHHNVTLDETELKDLKKKDIDKEKEVEEITEELPLRRQAEIAYEKASSPKFLGYIHRPSDLDEIPWTYYEQIRQGDFVRVTRDMWVAWTIGDDGEIGKNYECQLLAGDILVASNEFECDCATNIEDSYFQHWSILRPVNNRKSF
jgi:hypothetical protein